MENQDIRWKQRFQNYEKALNLLNNVLEKKISDYSELEKEGIIQRFEFCHELAWKVMKDYLNYQGNFEINGSRDATKAAFNLGLIHNGEIWMEMIKSRNLTSHTYQEEILEEMLEYILNKYLLEFNLFFEKMKQLNK